MLEQLLSDLNAYRECQVPLTRENAVNLKLFPVFEEPATVYDDAVPVPLVDLQQFLDRDCDWDMTMRRVIPFIDGANYTKRIAEQADVDLELARKAIQHLVYATAILCCCCDPASPRPSPSGIMAVSA